MWYCEECGHVCDTRWLMCPECSTHEDWDEALSGPWVSWAKLDSVAPPSSPPRRS